MYIWCCANRSVFFRLHIFGVYVLRIYMHTTTVRVASHVLVVLGVFLVPVPGLAAVVPVRLLNGAGRNALVNRNRCDQSTACCVARQQYPFVAKRPNQDGSERKRTEAVRLQV